MEAPSISWQQLRRRGRVRAEEVLRLFGITKPPIDVAWIARSLGAHLKVAANPGWAGAIKVDQEGATIWVRAEDHPYRKRFTIAHELGHLLLHDTTTAFRDNEHFSGGPLEAQANRFAAALLIPMPMLDAWAMRTRPDAARLAAEVFLVSEETMKIRLQEWEDL